MSHAPIPLSEDLISKFKGQTIAQSIRFFKCVVRDEQIVKTHEQGQTGSIEKDWSFIETQAKPDEPAYFLVRLEGTKRWLLLSWVPETAPVKARMTFATAKEYLKEKLGENFFVEELHASVSAELKYSHYGDHKAPVNALSAKEEEFVELKKNEEQARKDFAESLSLKTSSASSSPGIGGYHSVTLPLTAEAKTEIGKLRDGTCSFVELEITETNDNVKVVGRAKSVLSQDAVSKEISGNVPRFYIYVTNKISKQASLIYYCPEKSPQKLRMVYSTAKQGLADEINKTGLHISSRKIEITEPSDVVEELKRNPSSTTGFSPAGAKKVLEEGGGAVKAKNVPTVGGDGTGHNVYGLMNNASTQKTETKKKIVMPPPGAYGY